MVLLFCLLDKESDSGQFWNPWLSTPECIANSGLMTLAYFFNSGDPTLIFKNIFRDPRNELPDPKSQLTTFRVSEYQDLGSKILHVLTQWYRNTRIWIKRSQDNEFPDPKIRSSRIPGDRILSIYFILFCLFNFNFNLTYFI